MLRLRGVPRLIALLCLTIVLPPFTRSAAAQPAASITLSGAVLDPSGAFIPHAILHFRAAGRDRTATSDDAGHYTLTIAPGTYSLIATAVGFRSYTRTAVVIAPARSTPLNVTLEIATDTEEVNVTSDPASSTDASSNKSALVFKAGQLDTFSDDPSTMEQQLLALGGSDPTNPPQLYVDGFSNGTLPPKESIREIRINQNPFSAVYDQFGQGRIEILTKPGANKLEGGVDVYINNSALNTGNPYVGAQPSYSRSGIFGSFNGPLGKKSSFFFSVNRRDQNSNAIVNAVTGLDAGGNNITLTQAVPNPSLSQQYSLRFDHQFGAKDTFISRYTFADTTATNAGIGLLVLAEQGYSTHSRTQTLQLSDSHVFSPKVVFDSAFQYIRTRLRQDANSTAPAVIVQGAFNGGGNPAQSLHDNQDRIELQQYLSIAHGTHFIRTGLRYRLLREANLSTAGYNGEYDYPSLQAYIAHTPSQYSVTKGQPSASLLTGDIGVFADDEWKKTSNLTLNYGLRLESQSAIPDHFDVAPRVGFAYSLKTNPKAKDPILVFRGGLGIFYQRFAAANILQSLRQNGVSQQTFITQDPSSSSALQSTTPTIYRINPQLRSPAQYQALVSAEHSFGKYGTLSLQFSARRNTHAFESLNINAPLPGTYNPADPASGTRPFGNSGNIYQYSSDGVGNGRNVAINANINASDKVHFFLFAIAGHQDADVDGGFASNSYNVGQDAGRQAGYSPRQLYTGMNANPGHGFSIDVFVAARSGSPFNITLGRDLNGDTQYNDRPAFATDLTRASVVHTAYGDFDTAPLPTQTLIPANYGIRPATLYTELAINRSFRFGPRLAAPPSPSPVASPRPTGPVKPAELPPRRYRLIFGAEFDNPLNYVNRGAPVGVLTSPLFGRSISLNNQFTSNISANRTIDVHASFRF